MQKRIVLYNVKRIGLPTNQDRKVILVSNQNSQDSEERKGDKKKGTENYVVDCQEFSKLESPLLSSDLDLTRNFANIKY